MSLPRLSIILRIQNHVKFFLIFCPEFIKFVGFTYKHGFSAVAIVNLHNSGQADGAKQRQFEFPRNLKTKVQ